MARLVCCLHCGRIKGKQLCCGKERKRERGYDACFLLLRVLSIRGGRRNAKGVEELIYHEFELN